MRIGRTRMIAFTCALLTLATATLSDAQQEGGRRWGVGGNGGYSLPVLGMSDRFAGTSQVGAAWQIEYSPRLMLEVEYHRVDFDDGKEADRPFVWSVDRAEHLSPLAESRLRLNTVLLNVLVGYPGAASFRAEDFAYYIAVGGGVYHNKAERRNFIYPGQTTAPLNETLYLSPQVDKRASLGINAGMGVMAFVMSNVALDLRARYHIIAGELRPMDAWGFPKSTMPLQMLEISAGLKVYFRKS